jgi:hypothetical protein
MKKFPPNSQATPKWLTLFFLYFQHYSLSSLNFLYYFIKNPQTTIALTFLTHNISDIGYVLSDE